MIRGRGCDRGGKFVARSDHYENRDAMSILKHLFHGGFEPGPANVIHLE